jgi:hypothetical protein
MSDDDDWCTWCERRGRCDRCDDIDHTAWLPLGWVWLLFALLALSTLL